MGVERDRRTNSAGSYFLLLTSSFFPKGFRMASPQNVPSETGGENSVESLLRQIPSVDSLLSRAALCRLEERLGRPSLLAVTRDVLERLRTRIASGHSLTFPSDETLEEEIITAARARAEFSLLPVINASGVILHTNLGRAPLA